jgi:hypothetical protein
MEGQVDPFDFAVDYFQNQPTPDPYSGITDWHHGEHAPMNHAMASMPSAPAPTQLADLDTSTMQGPEQLGETPPLTPNLGNSSAQTNEKVCGSHSSSSPKNILTYS